MKKYIFTPFLVLLFALLRFQQIAKAQLTVVNNLQCWILVGEQEGVNCQFCLSPSGTWVPPIQNAPFNQVTFTSLDACATPFNEHWIGVKYGVGGNAPGPIGPGSFTYNPNYPGGACGVSQNNSQCQFNPVNPQWFQVGANGASFVIFQ